MDHDDCSQLAEPAPKRAKLTIRDIDTPGPGYMWVSEEESCLRCKKRKFRCAINPGRACWQCACTKYACSVMTTVQAQSRAKSQARCTPARGASTTRSSSRAATPTPLTRLRSQSQPHVKSLEKREQQGGIIFPCSYLSYNLSQN